LLFEKNIGGGYRLAMSGKEKIFCYVCRPGQKLRAVLLYFRAVRYIEPVEKLFSIKNPSCFCSKNETPKNLQKYAYSFYKFYMVSLSEI
jgi:hypothetical protein